MDPDDLQQITDRVVAMASPGEQVEAVAAWSLDTEIRVYESEVEHFVSAESAAIGVRVISDGRQGLSWAGVLDEAALVDCLAEARDNARFSSSDPHAGLAEPDGVEPVSLTLHDEGLAAVSTEVKIALAVELERSVRAGDPRIKGLESADYADSIGATAISSSTGIRSAAAETSVYLGCDALAGDDEETTTGFGFTVARGLDSLDPTAAASEAVERCVRLLGAGKAGSERLTVVLDPYVTSQFLGLVAELLSGEAVLRGRSPFAGRVGEVVASNDVHLLDDATDAQALSASDVDGEGLACRPVELIEDGVLSGFLHNAYTARASRTTSTGSALRSGPRSAPGVGPHVVTLRPGGSSHAEVLASVGDGLVVRELSGLHSGVNPVSGDVSVGVDGQRLRGGEPAEGVREVTIASSLQRMLLDVVVVGNDLTYFPWDATGVTLAIGDVMMSGH